MLTLEDIKPDTKKALMLAKRQISELVQDAVALEGILFTLPEIQTLLDGITVGGHKLSDQQIAVNQGEAWRFLFKKVETDNFELSADFAKTLHKIAGKEEALAWGDFRDGGVTISGTDYLPPDAAYLPSLFDQMVSEAQEIVDHYDRAIFIFLEMAKTQFFYDVNKRMGRFMMNGDLLSNGLPVINVPAKRQLEFNELMLDFYNSNDQTPMNHFLRSCVDPRVIKIMSTGRNRSS